jgi:hypothetical protein
VQNGDYERVFVIRAGDIERCPVCGELTADLSAPDDFRDSVNHLLAHGWKLIPVGQETSGDPMDSATIAPAANEPVVASSP